MSDAKIIKAKLKRLLPTVDINTVTLRSVQGLLEKELGVPLQAYKGLIKEEVDKFLMEGDGGEEGGEEEAEAVEEKQPAKKKQKSDSGAAARGGPPGGHVLQLSDKRFVTLSDWRGKWYLGVREYYEKEGELAPSSKGLSMAPEQWRVLEENLESLSTALEAKDESGFVELGGLKRAGPSNYGRSCTLDLREFYEKDGEARPTKKGISLTPEQWGALREGAPRVTAALLAKLGGSWPAAAKAAGKQPVADASGAGPSGQQQQQQDEAAGEGGEGGAVELSNSRRADVSVFKGKCFVNIREYYQKDGQQLPGKKGISLAPDQFAKLAEVAGALGEALRGQNTQFEASLSAKRKASISCFKGTYYVNIREYYEKDGQLAPGQKGISLPADQWAKLEAGLPRLQQQLAATGSG